MCEQGPARRIDFSEPELVADYACGVGENPIWHPDEQSVLWTDIPGGRLFRYLPATGTHEVIYSGRSVGGFTVQRDGSLLLFQDRGTVTSWRGGVETEVVAEIAAERELRFNDVIADARGRVFCGTYAEGRTGRLYRLDTDGTLTKVLDGIGCSNGLAFTRDGKGLFYIDSFAHSIYRFDYDEATGEISDQRVFYRVTPEQGFADGCTVDAEGHLWFALWGSSSIVRLDAAGRIETILAVPAQKVTSLCFGGQDWTTIYVTSEGGSHRSEQDPLAGATFRIRGSVAGKPEHRSNISTSAAPSFSKQGEA